MHEESNSLRGVQRLAAAILVQAIQDIRSGSAKKRDDAVRWIIDSRDEHFSFVFCCRILDRDCEEIRRFLVRQSLPEWAFRVHHTISAEPPTQTTAPQSLPRVSLDGAVR